MKHKRGVIGVGRTYGYGVSANTIATRSHYGMVDHYHHNDWNYKSTVLQPISYGSDYVGIVTISPNAPYTIADDTVYGLAITSDGKRLYTNSKGQVRIHEMETPFDTSTMSSIDMTDTGIGKTYRDYDNSEQYGFDISEDGKCMFIGQWSTDIIKYNLPYPFEFYDLLSGQQEYSAGNNQSFKVPDDITTISAVVVGGGGGGSATQAEWYPGGGGGGGGLSYGTFSVTPGETLTVNVGAGGNGGVWNSKHGKVGGNSQIKRGSTVLLQGGGGGGGSNTSFAVGIGGDGGTSTGTEKDGGGEGGEGGSPSQSGSGGGGGGAAGYSGDGGDGADSSFGTGQSGSGGGGGGGGGDDSAGSNANGGGVGVFGEGQSGTGGSGGNSANPGSPGSGGTGGEWGGGGAGAHGGPEGQYGTWPDADGQSGLDGRARIIFGSGRTYPTVGAVGDMQPSVQPFAGRKIVSHESSTNSNGLNNIPSGFTFNPSGTKMYTVGADADEIGEFNISPAWDISSKTYNAVKDISSEVSLARAIDISSNGLIVMVVCETEKKIFKYTLSTAWDISSASYSQSWTVPSTSNADNDIKGMRWKSDGTRFWICSNTDEIRQYDVDTAWDLTSTITLDTTLTVSLNASISSVQNIAWTNDGSQFLLVTWDSDEAVGYSVSTAWDVTGASKLSSYLSTSGIDLDNSLINLTEPQDVFFSNDSTAPYVFFFGRTDSRNIYRYNMHNINDIKSIDLGFWTQNDSWATDIEWRSDGMMFFLSDSEYGDNESKIRRFTVNYPFNMNPYYDLTEGSSLDVSDDVGNNVRSFTMRTSSKGDIVIVTSNDNDYVLTYKLNTPWDLSTAVKNTHLRLDLGNFGGHGIRAMTSSKNKGVILLSEKNNHKICELKLNF